ncbi:MAG TPA: hypothetical protein PK183_05245 [Bacillota bacterium]|nr:hypothetical protein [Bacillota bacterium]
MKSLGERPMKRNLSELVEVGYVLMYLLVIEDIALPSGCLCCRLVLAW